MTDKQLEAAARRFCKLEGVDPNEPDGSRGYYLGSPIGPPMLRKAEQEIRTIYHAILAIEMAMEEDRSPENTDKT